MRGPKPKPIDVDEAVRLYREGKSLREVGAMLGTTGVTIRSRLVRAGVVCRPEGYQRNPAVPIRHKSPAEQPVIKRAHRMVEEALRAGEIVKPATCEACGSKRKLCAHHADYNKPLAVEWLCSFCHRKWHRENTAIFPSAPLSWVDLRFKRASRLSVKPKGD